MPPCRQEICHGHPITRVFENPKLEIATDFITSMPPQEDAVMLSYDSSTNSSTTPSTSTPSHSPPGSPFASKQTSSIMSPDSVPSLPLYEKETYPSENPEDVAFDKLCIREEPEMEQRDQDDVKVEPNTPETTTATACKVEARETPRRRARREVSFESIQIRRYPLILGDNPSCCIGAPLTLDWEYEEGPTMSLDDFEASRCQHRRARLQQMVISYYRRIAILKRCGYSEEEVKKIDKAVAKAQRQRTLSTMFAPLDQACYCAKSACHKVKKRCSLRRTPINNITAGRRGLQNREHSC